MVATLAVTSGMQHGMLHPLQPPRGEDFLFLSVPGGEERWAAQHEWVVFAFGSPAALLAVAALDGPPLQQQGMSPRGALMLPLIRATMMSRRMIIDAIEPPTRVGAKPFSAFQQL